MLFDVDEDSVEEAGMDIMYCLIVLYSILFLLCFGVAVHAIWTVKGWNIVKLLKVLLPWPILARDISFFINIDDTTYMTGSVGTQSNVFLIFTSGASGYLLFSVFLLLVLFWIYLYHLSSSKIETFVKHLLLTYVSLNIIVYTIWFLLLITMKFYPTKLDTVHMVEGTYAASLNILVCVGFATYGARLLVVLKKQQAINFITRRIFLLTVVCSGLFLLRSAWILVNEFVFSSPLVNLFGATFNDLFCELLPITFILVVLCWPTHKTAFSQIESSERTKFPVLNESYD